MSKRAWFWLVFGAGVLIRLYGINNPLLDNHAWRQVDTASMAANFLQQGFLPLVPQLNYDGPPPNYAELEFPVVPLVVAALWSVFGKSDFLARLAVLLFSGGTLILIYLCGKKLYDTTSGILTMAFFSVNPLAIYYGRTVMPDSAMLFFMCVSLLFALRWYDTKTWRDLVLSAAGFALAVLAKLPGLLIGVPILILAYQRYKHRIFLTREFWVFIAIAIVPPMAYYWFAHSVAQTQFVSGIVQSQFSVTLPGYEYLWKKLAAMVTRPLILVAGLGLFARRARQGNVLLWGWLLLLLVYTLTVGARIQLEYYLLPVIPLLCLLAGGGLGRFWGDAPGVVSSLLIFLICLNIVSVELRWYYQVDSSILNQAKLVEDHTRQTDLLVLSDSTPMTFYYSDRKGWRLPPEKQTPRELEKLRAQGGMIFVVLPGNQLRRDFKEYLDKNYPFVPEGSYYELSKGG